MLNNMVKVPKEIIINQERISHRYRLYKFYWEYTHNIKFLKLYKEALKEFYISSHYLIQNYLKPYTFDFILTDTNNSYIYYCMKQDLEDFDAIE